MIINKLYMKNFRPFYGENEIVFSEGSKNITIIYGNNGEGKTSIFRALMFCLFGDLMIEQDDRNMQVHLVNKKAVFESDSPVTSSVKVDFEHNGSNYSITRSRVAVKRGESQIERDGQVELIYTDPNGNTNPQPIDDVSKINNYVSKIVNDEMKNFFFFDGEQINTLTTAKEEVRKSVRSTIRTVSQVDDLSKTLQILKDLNRQIDKDIGERSQNHILIQKIKESDDLEDEISKNVEVINFYYDENKVYDTKIEQLTELIKEDEKARLIVDKISMLEDRVNDNEDIYIKESKFTLNESIKTSPLVLLNMHHNNISEYLKAEYQKESDIIPLPALEKTIREKKCACCGLSLEDHIERFNNIKRKVESYNHNNMTEFISIILNHYKNVNVDELVENIQKNLGNLKISEDKKHSIEQEVDIENSKLTKLDNTKEKVMRAVADKDLIVEKRKTNENKIITLQERIKVMSNELDLLKSSIEEITENERNISIYTDSKKKINKTLEHLNNIISQYNAKIQEVLTRKTTENFKMLIKESDKNLVEKIEINKRYEINIYDKHGLNALQDISLGQRKVASIAFIMSLAQIASESTGVIKYPFFMDTPFANFDLENRKSVIGNIPNLISQWVLLLTDTELSTEEEVHFKSTNRLGKWYRIEKVNNEYSSILNVSINDTLVDRR